MSDDKLTSDEVFDILKGSMPIALAGYLMDAVHPLGREGLEMVQAVREAAAAEERIKVEAQAAEIERLREAGNDLGFYAGHEDACDCVKGWAKGPCNCGYTEAWQAWHSLAGKAEQ